MSALKLGAVLVLVLGCNQTAVPTTTPLDRRHVFLVDFSADRRLLVIDNSELIVEVVRDEVAPGEITTEPAILQADRVNQAVVGWFSSPCDPRQSIIVSGSGARLAFDIYSGPRSDGECPATTVANGILVTFTTPPAQVTGAMHQGSPPQ